MRGQVVVIDDEVAVLEVLQQVLEREGFSVLGVDDPAVMMQDNHGLCPAIFLVDVALSGSRGIQVAEHLRTLPFSSTPMIAMAASTAMARHVARSSLFDGILEKPFDKRQLLTAIEQLLVPAT